MRRPQKPTDLTMLATRSDVGAFLNHWAKQPANAHFAVETKNNHFSTIKLAAGGMMQAETNKKQKEKKKKKQQQQQQLADT